MENPNDRPRRPEVQDGPKCLGRIVSDLADLRADLARVEPPDSEKIARLERLMTEIEQDGVSCPLDRCRCRAT